MNKKQLWDSILQQAISGKLVPQLDSEPAVEQIGPAPSKDEEPFALPEKWKWVKLGELLPFGVSAQVSPEQIPIGSWVLGLEDIQSNGSLISKQFIKNKVGSNKNIFKAGNVLYGKMRPYLNKVIIADSDGFCSTEIFVLDVHQAALPLYSYFLKSFLQSPYFVTFATNHSRGQKPRLETKAGQQAFVPLPPLEEQRRIVAKLEELKPLVDQFGEAHDKLSELEADFPRKLKASILLAAMQGKLVPQLDSEPAVEQIGPAPAPDEVLFKLPEKWKWVKLKTIGQIIGGGTPSSAVAEYWDKPTINWITSADLRANKGIFIYSGARSISQLGLQKSSAKLFPAGTVIYTTRGACIGDVAVAALESCTNQGCKSFVPDTAHITSLWGYYALKHAAPFIRRLSSGTTFAEISGKRFSEIAIPLPPLEEQRRIVERIEQLFAEVDKMSACKAP